MLNAIRGALALVALALLSGWAHAQVGDGSQWTWSGGSETCTVNVEQLSHFNEGEVSYTDSHGTSSTVTGTLGAGSSEENPNVSDAGAATTPADGEGNPGATYRVHNGKVEKKNEAGEWVRGTEKKVKKKGVRAQLETLQAGEPAPHRGVLVASGQPDVLLLTGDPAPHAGNFHAVGDEVVSLPGPPTPSG